MHAGVVVTGLVLAGLTLGCAASGPPRTGTAEVVQLTGKQLAAALLPASRFPSGVAVFQAPDSGNRLESGARVDLATASCGTFYASFNGPGLGESAFASRTYSTAGFAQQFTQAVYQLRNADSATTFFRHVRAGFSRCSSATVGITTISVRSLSAVPVSGHPSIQLNLTTVSGGQTARLDLVVSVAGLDVFDVINTGLQAPPPASPDPRTIMSELITRVRSAR